MLDVNQIITYENGDLDEQQEAALMQAAINAGQWGMQGSYGRAMMGAIESGMCMLGKDSARDYWGNFIPSRDMVASGTKGSYEFVADRMGAEWADQMSAVA